MAWIFQGNPQRFDIDDYLSRYPELLYWRTPRHQSEISVGDRAFIWRAGKNAGVVAIGSVVEVPTPGVNVMHPEALGADLWHADQPDPNEPRTGIHLDEVRITDQERYLPRNSLREHAAFAQATIITMPNGTVFPLNNEQAQVIEQYWGFSPVENSPSQQGATEGERKLRSHYRRERSVSLRSKKLEQVYSAEGKYVCALCGIDDSMSYPGNFGGRIFEVHHLSPLAMASTPVRTTLDDLAVLCANCHRAVHASPSVEENYATIQAHFRGKR